MGQSTPSQTVQFVCKGSELWILMNVLVTRRFYWMFVFTGSLILLDVLILLDILFIAIRPFTPWH